MASPNIEGIQEYQKNLHLSPEHKQSLAADIDRYHNADNIWDTMRHEFTLPHYEDSSRVLEQIEWFMNNQDFLYRSASRAAPYLYYILQQVRMRHLPAEVALIPIIESAFNPFAYSPAGAAGIWQMMPGTASGYGVKQNWWYDGRRDVVTSTKAALNHLAYLDNFFEGNWLYAVAAYDTGEGNVLSAIKKNVRDGISTDFWSIPVAQETRDYIPKLLALAIIISHPDQYPIELPYVRNAPYLAQVDIGGQIDLKHAATLAGLSFQELKQLNSGYNRSATGPNGPFKLVLPIENVEEFTENLVVSPLYQHMKWTYPKSRSKAILEAERTRTEVRDTTEKNERVIIRKKILAATSDSDSDDADGRPYTLKPGDTLYMVRANDDLNKIAHRFHISTSMLKIANNLQSNALKPGDKIIVPTHAAGMDHNNDTEIRRQIAPGETLYMVRKGDTIEKIANKYKISPATLRLANLKGSSTVKEGDELIIPSRV
jgi:membrane-bound lytic murein transglycosylase D